MTINKKHIPWAFFTLIASLAAGVLYLANFHPEHLPFAFQLPSQFGPVPPTRNTVGGTPLGILFGSLALAIFLFAAALGIRKKRRLWRIGSPQTWVRAHIWLTVLTLPLVLFHSGFALGGPMSSILMVLYAIVMVSGFWGVAMQHYLPRVMTESLPREVVFEQIPHLRKTLVEAAEKLRAEMNAAARSATQGKATSLQARSSSSAGGTVVVAPNPVIDLANADQSIPMIRAFLDDDCLPYLRAGRGERHRLGTQKVAEDVFRILKLNVSDKFHPQVDAMQTWCEERRLMDRQSSLQHWLHGWLIIHVPFSFALLILTMWHAWIALTYL